MNALSPATAAQDAPLRAQIEASLRAATPEPIAGDVMALVVPGGTHPAAAEAAAAAYRLIEGEDFDTVLVVAPSHDGHFGRLTICRADDYPSALGGVPVNDALRNELCDEDDDIFLDDAGHYREEGIKAQLPFLQVALGEGFSVVPIVMGEESTAFCRELGGAVGEVMYGRRALLVACADVLGAEGDALDRFADALTRYDVPELLHLLSSETLRVDGCGPVVVAVLAAQARGANCARLVRSIPPSGGQPGALACALWRE